MLIRPELEISEEEIAAFCRRHHIRWLAVFGSVLRDDFGPESDVDVLVEFEPGKTPGFGFIDVQDELSELFGGRAIDLGTRASLNRWIRARVLSEAKVLYDAT
ncbi:MAG: nucleotidyltransferase [Chloroflexota bacterium]